MFYIMQHKTLVNTLFPGVFLFNFSSCFALSSFENREKTKGKRQMGPGVKNRKTKSRSTRIVKSWYFCLCFTLFYFRPDKRLRAGGKETTSPLCAFTLRSYFIQKPFTQITLFLHVWAIYFNHSKQQELLHQKRLQDFFHNTRADKNLSALLPFLILFSRRRIIHGMVCFFVYPGSGA